MATSVQIALFRDNLKKIDRTVQTMYFEEYDISSFEHVKNEIFDMYRTLLSEIESSLGNPKYNDIDTISIKLDQFRGAIYIKKNESDFWNKNRFLSYVKYNASELNREFCILLSSYF